MNAVKKKLLREKTELEAMEEEKRRAAGGKKI